MGGDRVPTAGVFRRALEEEFRLTTSLGRQCVEVNAGGLHRKVGGYPGHNHRMPVVCGVMYRAMQEGDEILSRPPQGQRGYPDHPLSPPAEVERHMISYGGLLEPR